jgi:flagellar biosynthetic protein FliO
MQSWLSSLISSLREKGGMTIWIWIVILLVVLGIGTIMGMPYQNIDGAAVNSGVATMGSTGHLISVFLKWMAVIGLMYIAFIFLKRWQFGGISNRVKQLTVIERLSLSQKQAILLVRVGNRQLLLGATDQNITLITELDQADEIQPEFNMGEAHTLDGGKGFSSILDKKMTGIVSDFFSRSNSGKE